MQEIWKDIPGWEGMYSVSNFGNVKSLKRTINENVKEGCRNKNYQVQERILKKSIQPTGHLRVSLSKNSKVKYRMIHSLVLLAFVGKKPAGTECCHKDGNPANNTLSNLYYGTRSENINDAKKHGTFPMGSKRPGAILTEEEAKEIYELCEKRISDHEIAKLFNVTKGCVVQIRLGKNWKEQTGGKPISRTQKKFEFLTTEQKKLILDQSKTTTKIGLILGHDRHTILKWRRKLLQQ